jgi:hypothetical protein
VSVSARGAVVTAGADLAGLATQFSKSKRCRFDARQQEHMFSEKPVPIVAK